MSKIKVIKTEKDYEEALKLVETLMGHNPEPDSEKGEQLNLLSTLIEDYETRVFPEKLPDPIDAIKFRMEQGGLKSADLIPYIGSPSRVSEILSGKRRLTLKMVRVLEANLGIPAKVLIRKSDHGENSQYQDWNTRLVAEMEARGYFGDASLKKYDKGKLLKNFFSSIRTPAPIFVMLRKSSYRSSPLTDKHALTAWSVYVIKKAKKIKRAEKYKHGVVNLIFMQKLAKLSTEKNSPVLAREHLGKHGITLVIEPHFPKTYLDGAAILINKDNPVIGLTLRHDRLDNFWFTLMHELAHVALHYNQDIDIFYDELDNVKGLDISQNEKEADDLAGEALVSSSKWEISPAKLVPSSIAANSLAKELGVHVAIIAGKIRYEGGKWTYLNNIIDQAKVQKYFPNEKWNKK